MNNFENYNVYKEVSYEGQEVIGTRFVLTEKPNGDIKARLVVKGFEEESSSTDSPTVSRDTFKVFCALSANEKWNVEASDVRSAFLQADKLDREVFIEPPLERKKEGIVWQLIRPVYGLKDAARKWFESTVKTLTKLGMTQCYNDCCLFYYRHKNKLSGLILFHVDNFLSSGTEEFHKNVIVELRKTYQFGKISSERFVFTGLQFYQNKEKEIFIDQFEYADRMELFNMTINTQKIS